MSSSDRSDALDLEHDLPTTTEDVAALRRAKASRPLDLAEYIRFLERLPSQDSRSIDFAPLRSAFAMVRATYSFPAFNCSVVGSMPQCRTY